MVGRSRRKQRLSRRGGLRKMSSLFRRNSKKRTRRKNSNRKSKNNNNSYNKPKIVYEDPSFCQVYVRQIYNLKTENNLLKNENILLKKQVEMLLNQQKENKNTSVSAYYNDNELYY